MHGHRALYEGPKILHQNISINNTSCFVVGRTTGLIGIHTDFDLAVFNQMARYESRGPFRTGTVPFMAIDLLQENDKTHWVRHDLESLLWVIVWYTAQPEPSRFGGNLPWQLSQ